MVVAQRIQAVAKPVLVEQRRDDHGVHDASVDSKAHAFDPTQIVLSVVHDLFGRAFEHFLQPPINNFFV